MTPPYPKPSKKKTSMGQQSKKQVDERRDNVQLRDDYQCVVKGTAAAIAEPCSGPLTVQHRIGKGMGGSALFDSYAHLITMCWFHNFLAEQDAAFADACRLNGWSIPRGRNIDPSKVPVRYHSGCYALGTTTWERQWIPVAMFDFMMVEVYG